MSRSIQYSSSMEITVSCITCQQHYAVEGCTRKQTMKDTLGQKLSLVQFSLVQDGIYALSKALMCSIPSLRHFPNIAYETVPMFISLTMVLSHPFKKDHLALPLSTPFSSM